MLISETLLGAKHQLRIANYSCYRKDEKNQDGRPIRGLAVLVHRRIVHQLLPHEEFQSIYVLGIRIALQNRQTNIKAIYRPPNALLRPEELRKALRTGLPTIMAGDLNAKHPYWNSRGMCRNGKILYNDAMDHHYDVIGPDSPTHYNTGGTENVLDIAVIHDFVVLPVQSVLSDLDSDHRPVQMVLADTPSRVAPWKKGSRINWDIYKETLESAIEMKTITNRQELEEQTNLLTTNIQASLKKATLPTTNRDGKSNSLPGRIWSLIREKREVRLEWQTTRCPTIKRELNSLIVKVKNALDEHAEKRWKDHIDNIDEDIPSVHRLCKRIYSTPEPVRPMIDKNNHLQFDAEHRAEIFAKHLEDQFSPNPGDEDFIREIEAEVQTRLNTIPTTASTEQKIFFTPNRVATLAKKLKNRKAPGLDGVTNEAIKHMPMRALLALTNIFNGVMRTGYLPSSWKAGKVVMLPKPGKDSRRPENYRPITLLSMLSKLLEKLLMPYIRPHITPRNEQYGFRSEHSTTLQITRILHYMISALNKKEFTVAVFLDMEKAFDKVWHEGMLYKLSNAPITHQILRILASFLENRTCRVQVDDKMSREIQLKAGVPQGSCLSPVCYAWYTDDIPVVGQAQLALYADDTAYYTSSLKAALAAKRLQQTLDVLPEWLKKWRLSVNVAKTQAIVTGGVHQPTPLTLQGQSIPWSPTVNYLGVKIDRRLNFTEQTKTTIEKVKGTRARLAPVFKSRLQLRIKTMVYKMYVRSRLTYAAPAWYHLLAASNKKKLRIQESLTLRAIVSAPRVVRNATIARDLKIRKLDKFIQGAATRMFARADESSFEHVRNIAPLHARPPDEPGRRKTKPLAREQIINDSDHEED